MTGRELILYILENGLEDEQVVKNGKLIGFLTLGEFAAKTNVGTATVTAWIYQKRVPSVTIGDTIYIPATFKLTICSVSA